MPLSTVTTDEGTLVVTWSLPVPADAVWAAFTDSALMSQWLGEAVEGDVTEGGKLVVDHGDGYLCTSSVTETVQPHRLAMSWQFPDEPRSHVAFDLQPSDDGTAMGLTHQDLGELVDSYAPGWLTHLTFLEAAVAGAPITATHFWTLHGTFESLYSRGVIGAPR